MSYIAMNRPLELSIILHIALNRALEHSKKSYIAISRKSFQVANFVCSSISRSMRGQTHEREHWRFLTRGIASWSLFLCKNTLQKALPDLQEEPRDAHSSRGTLSRNLFLDSRNSFDVSLSRNTLQEARPGLQECSLRLMPFQEHSPGSSP